MMFNYPRGGINWNDPVWSQFLEEKEQCYRLQNIRCNRGYAETIKGTRRYHGTSLGSDPITAILPYYNDQTDQFDLLAACGDLIAKRDPQSNEFVTLESGLTPNSVHNATIRHGVMYIPSENDGLKKYLGGSQLEAVGGGSTKPGNFRYCLYMKEIDRLFGISDDAIFGQITWSNISDPENWDGANVERLKLKDGERVEGAAILYGKLIIFCTYTIWIYYVSGNEENWKLEEAPTIIGCVAPNTIIKVGSEIWYLGESPSNQLGVYAFNGSHSRLLTYDIEPIFKMLNRNVLRNACAVLHDDLYKLSFSTGYGGKNNASIDLDITNTKKDGTPAIYGIHTIGFRSACVLDGRQNDKEILLGDDSDGFVYKEGGYTLKSTDGTDGELLQPWFTSRAHAENIEVVKRYTVGKVAFRPRGYFLGKFRYILSSGTYQTEHTFNPNTQSDGLIGDFDIYDLPLVGTPRLSEYNEFLGHSARGNMIQIELVNDVLNGRIDFDKYGFEYTDLHTSRKVQRYA